VTSLENYYAGDAQPRKHPELADMFCHMALRSLAMYLEFDNIANDVNQSMEVRIHFRKRATNCWSGYLKCKTLEVRNL
jgi:hypothetical protein